MESSSKRNLIVSHIPSLDGDYEGKGRSPDRLFDYFHEDYHGDEHLDHYMAERMRITELLPLGGEQEGKR